MSELVTYKQAKRLIKLGYAYRSTKYVYRVDNQNLYNSYEVLIQYPSAYAYIKAPLISEALDFIREEKDILCAVELFRKTNRFGSLIDYRYSGAYIGDDNKEVLLKPRRTNPEAENALLNALLDYLESRPN